MHDNIIATGPLADLINPLDYSTVIDPDGYFGGSGTDPQSSCSDGSDPWDGGSTIDPW